MLGRPAMSPKPVRPTTVQLQTFRGLFLCLVAASAVILPLVMSTYTTVTVTRIKKYEAPPPRFQMEIETNFSRLGDCLQTLLKPKSSTSTLGSFDFDQVHVPQDPRNVTSWQELQNIVSKLVILDNTVAIYRSNNSMDWIMRNNFPQNFWPPGVAPYGCYRKLYDSAFYTLKQQNSCALVGNGGILKDSKCGAVIDSHDFVMRANLPEIAGFEEDVGQKTDLTAVNTLVGAGLSKHLTRAQNSSVEAFTDKLATLARLNNSVVWFAYNLSSTAAKYMKGLRPKFYNALKESQFHRQDLTFKAAYSPVPIWPELMRRLWKKTKNTEGFVLLTLSTLFCQEITLYGFWPFAKDPKGRHVPHHYYGKTDYDHGKSNHIPEEFAILQNFNRSNVIRLVSERCADD